MNEACIEKCKIKLREISSNTVIHWKIYANLIITLLIYSVFCMVNVKLNPKLIYTPRKVQSFQSKKTLQNLVKGSSDYMKNF